MTVVSHFCRFVGRGFDKLARFLLWHACAVFLFVVSAARGELVDFNDGLPEGLSMGSIYDGGTDYQPVAGTIMGYGNVGLYNSGPDHTTGVSGTNHYHSYPYNGNYPQTILFDTPVAIPSLWATNYSGATSPITIRAYSSVFSAPSTQLGTFTVTPTAHGGSSNFVWTEYTGLPAAGQEIRRLEIRGNIGQYGVLDDMNAVVGATLTPASAIKVMPLGDSITHGSRNHVGYRYPLYGNLEVAGYDVDFVGSMSSLNSDLPLSPSYSNYIEQNDIFFDKDHEGHGGYRTDHILSDTSVTNSISVNQADMVFLHLGSNDLGQGTSSSSNNYAPAINNLMAIVGRLRAANPNVRIALAQIVPFNPSGSGYGRAADEIPGFNARVAALGESLSTPQSPIEVVDLYTDFDPKALTHDGIHPNVYGEQLMADRSYIAFQKLMHPGTPVVSPEVRVANQSFEHAFLSDGEIAGRAWNKGWTFDSTDSSFSGVWNPPSTNYLDAAGLGTARGADGARIGFVYNTLTVPDESQLCSIEQTLGAILMPETLYELTVAVGKPHDIVYGGYRLELFAGDRLIGFQEDAVEPDAGTFTDASFNILSDTLDPALFGESLKIRLSATSLAFETGTGFDNIRLTTAVVPEPATIWLVITSLPFIWLTIRRRPVKPTAS
ncbi:MAG: PEP-CTERM sorting domain-containing protein [Candidatus Nealsonbacteria bacterium]|nr:PEP-CTERM sorting domain-containing protein [Candidatus Nealsonbacteria bacterium]